MTQDLALPPLLAACTGGVLTVTLNRPEARNALSESLMRAFQLTLDEAVDDANVKVIVIAAQGPAFNCRPRPGFQFRTRSQRDERASNRP
jgi:1,4-dihydroxy-2-naphthoyl-CoA synthase